MVDEPLTSTTYEGKICQYRGNTNPFTGTGYGQPSGGSVACDSSVQELFDWCVTASQDATATFNEDDIAPNLRRTWLWRSNSES